MRPAEGEVKNEEGIKHVYSEVIMSQKKVTILITALALIGSATAGNLLTNPGFEDPAGTGWTQWWGGNSNRHVTDPIDLSDYCAGVWWDDDGIFQGIDVGPGKYVFGGELSHGTLGNGRLAVIQAEIGDGVSTWWTQQIVIGQTDPLDTWLSGTGDNIIDNTAAGATHISINLLLLDPVPHTGVGIARYDNIYLAPVIYLYQAKNPVPADGASVPVSLDVLSWDNPDPNSPSDTITSDVWFYESSSPTLSDPGLLGQIADDITAESVTLSALVPSISLTDNMYYFWRVDCTDPNSGGNPATTQGEIWRFSTGDVPPVPEAGPTQYLWLDMDDGDGNPMTVTFDLNGSFVEEDGKSPVTTLWSLDYSEQDPATTIDIDDPNALTTSVVIDGTGLFRFLLHAEDAVGFGEDTTDVYVYGTACEAAQGDPDDHYQTYEFVGDTNNDCIIDMVDLANVAATWLDCLSDKLGCTP